MNSAVEHAHEQSRAWAERVGLLMGKRAARAFDAAKFARLTARAYPTAAPPELVLVARWNVWLFVHDDCCDAGPDGHDPEALREMYEQLRGILHGRHDSRPDTTAARAFAELVPRILARGSCLWRNRFVDAVDAYFSACIWEAENRANARVPTIAEYVTMRRDTGAVRTAIAMIEICENIELPETILVDPLVQELADACNDVVCWANDIISLPKERAERDVHNLVFVIDHEVKPGNLARAATNAMDMHDARVADFIRLAAALPSSDALIDAQLRRFVSTLQAWMRGNLDWARESGRYSVPVSQTPRSLDEPRNAVV